MKKVGEIIKEGRQKEGVSQQRLATAIGILSDAQISRVEAGKERLTCYRLKLACTYLRLDFDKILKIWLNESPNRKFKEDEQCDRK